MIGPTLQGHPHRARPIFVGLGTGSHREVTYADTDHTVNDNSACPENSGNTARSTMRDSGPDLRGGPFFCATFGRSGLPRAQHLRWHRISAMPRRRCPAHCRVWKPSCRCPLPRSPAPGPLCRRRRRTTRMWQRRARVVRSGALRPTRQIYRISTDHGPYRGVRYGQEHPDALR